MEAKVDTKFKTSDNILKELVLERRKDVELLQKEHAAKMRMAEEEGQRRLSALQHTLNKDTADQFQKLNKLHIEEEKKAATALLDLRKKFAASPKHGEDTFPGLKEGSAAVNTVGAVGWKTPYYGVLHGSDGSVYWQGYNPGNIDLWDTASGSGSGIFGTGAASFTVHMDHWFAYTTEASRFYNHNIYVPFHGFEIARADDGFWDSKEAHVRIDLSALGYQYNAKPMGRTNVFDIDSQNINSNDRIDGWRTMYYADLLGGGDTAYLRVTSSFYVYARGGGSFAELNFSDGAANYLGIPQVYIG